MVAHYAGPAQRDRVSSEIGDDPDYYSSAHAASASRYDCSEACNLASSPHRVADVRQRSRRSLRLAARGRRPTTGRCTRRAARTRSAGGRPACQPGRAHGAVPGAAVRPGQRSAPLDSGLGSRCALAAAPRHLGGSATSSYGRLADPDPLGVARLVAAWFPPPAPATPRAVGPSQRSARGASPVLAQVEGPPSRPAAG